MASILEGPAKLSRVDGELELQGWDLLEDLNVGVVLESVAAGAGFLPRLEAEALRKLETGFIPAAAAGIVVLAVDAVVPSQVVARRNVVSECDKKITFLKVKR